MVLYPVMSNGRELNLGHWNSLDSMFLLTTNHNHTTQRQSYNTQTNIMGEGEDEPFCREPEVYSGIGNLKCTVAYRTSSVQWHTESQVYSGIQNLKCTTSSVQWHTEPDVYSGICLSKRQRKSRRKNLYKNIFFILTCIHRTLQLEFSTPLLFIISTN